MTVFWQVLGWILSIVFVLLLISMLLLQKWGSALLLLLIILLVLPPVSAFIQNRFTFALHPLLRVGLVIVMMFFFVRTLMPTDTNSIYNSPDIQARFYELYDQKMQEWPGEYEDQFLDTQYGAVHVITCGAEDSPPLVLLHASGVASWSWKFNAEELCSRYRIYAIDTIGDANKSEYASLDHILATGEDQADLYADITNQLGVESSFVVGASEGGFIASNYALHYPERVKRLALLGPMGYSGAMQSVMRIMFAQFFPLKPVQENTFSWAFSDSDALKDEYGEWFRVLMSGTYPKKVAPLSLSAEERQSIQVPVMFVFGERDNLVGDPVKAEELVQDVADVRVEIVNAGHLMGAEIPEEIDALLIEFFEEDSTN